MGMNVEDEKDEDWMQAKWRPAMGWMYMVVCSFDFVIAPILWSVLQAISKGSVSTQWQPLTLQGAGLFHLAMGAVLGIAAFGRTQEKIAGASTTSTAVASPLAPIIAPAPVVNNTIVPVSAVPLQQVNSTVVTGYAGKAAPSPAQQPSI